MANEQKGDEREISFFYAHNGRADKGIKSAENGSEINKFYLCCTPANFLTIRQDLRKIQDMKLDKLYNLDYKKNKHQIALIAAICCFLCILIAFLPNFARGNTFVWFVDGKDQHLTFLQYITESGGLANIGKFDFNLGFGEDYLFYFAYYMLCDPFNLLFYILPSLNASVVYSIIVVLKFSTMFAVMFLYLKHKNAKPILAIVGACCYILVGTAIFSIPRHPQFAAGFIYFPLIVWGIELVMENKRPYILIASIFLCLLSNYYQFYICAVCGALYGLLYYFVLHPVKTEKFSFKKFALTFLKVIAYCLVPILLASFLLVPVVLYTLNAPRSSGKGFSLLTGVSLKNYIAILLGYLCPSSSPNYTMLGLNIFIVLCLCLFISTFKGRNLLIFWVFTAMLFIPLFGYITNVFNYFSGRWFFVYAFIAIVCAVFGMSRLEDAEDTQKAGALKLFLTFILLCAFATLTYFMGLIFVKINTILAIFVLLAFSALGIFLVVLFFKKVKINTKISNKVYSRNFVVVALMVTSLIAALSYNIYYSTQFISVDEYNSLITSAQQYIAEQNRGQLYRADRGSMPFATAESSKNTNLLNRHLSTLSYNSNSNGNIYDFLDKNGLTSIIGTLGSNGLDSRVGLQAICNVNYYLSVDENVPYGFTKVDGYENLYYNQNALSFGTFYTNTISASVADKLSSYELSNLMLEALIVDDDAAEYDYQKSTVQLSSTAAATNCKLKENKIVANKDASITFTVSDCANKEVYLTFNKLRYNFNKLSFVDKILKGQSEKYFTVSTASRSLSYTLYPSGHQMYNGDNNDYIINLGYYDEDELKITLKLDAGEYDFADMQIVGYDMDVYQNNIDNLKQGPSFNLDNFAAFDGKHLSGDITTTEEGYLFLSIPYSSGWSATVDGKEAKLLKANYGFMAIKLSEGHHEIKLTYSTAGLNAGCIFALDGILILVAIVVADVVVIQRRKRLSDDQNKES